MLRESRAAGHASLRDNLAALARAGLLHRVDRAICKDTELMALVKWQFRGLPESERRAWHFTRITDARGREFDAEVAVATIGASRAVYACALDCPVEEIAAHWTRARSRPIAPALLGTREAPVKEVVVRGAGLKSFNLDSLPIPILLPGLDPAPFFTAAAWVTKDPETGIRNIGNYRGHVKAPDRVTFFCAPNNHGHLHWAKWKKKGARYMEAAAVVGVPPVVNMCAVSKLPYGVDEYDIAGGLLGRPVELVKCETVDIEVPAHAEIVIEGRVSTEWLEPEGPFGEFTGFMGAREAAPPMEVTCITHRRRPIWHAFISEYPPSESTMMRTIANEGQFFDLLKNQCNVGGLLDVYFHEPSGAQHFIVIRLKKSNNTEPMRAMLAAASVDPAYGKFIVAVDEDVDPRDLDAVMWAVTFRVQPHRDVQIVNQRSGFIDPSAAPFDAPAAEKAYPQPSGASSLLIDATCKFDYPPVSLPAREYMLKAKTLWEELGLPALTPREPWYGYEMGPWPREWAEEAERAARGEYHALGDLHAAQRKPAG